MSEYKKYLLSQNCTNAAIYQFPDFLSYRKNVHDHVYEYAAIGILVSAYLFLALAIVCDEFLVPAVEQLCYVWRIPYNIAGATFMAAATSAPEFFVNVVGTFVTEGDIGVGTIVGSSVFNSLAITACCGLSGVSLSLDWWPLTRDLFWYFIAVITVTIIILDDIVMWYESVILIILFIIYLLCMCLDKFFQKQLRNPDPDIPAWPCFRPTGEVIDFAVDTENDPIDNADEEPFHLLQYPSKKNCCAQFMYLLCWPVQLIYFFTIPNCRYLVFRKWYILTMILATVWISLLSYVIAWMLTVVGYIFYIPDTVMGITLLAAGTSIPEAVSSIIVTRKGYGSMAVCNAVGSNTFDILICLGVPWLIKALTYKTDEQFVILNSLGLAYDSSSLVLTGLVLYISFMVMRFTLGPAVGKICLVTYLVYVVIACLIETNVFGMVNLPTCPANFIN